MKYLLVVFVMSLGLTACDKKSSTDGTKERARAEQEAGKDVSNDNLAQKAKKMEQDLRKRYRFYTGISHNYVGSFQIGENRYKAKMTFTPTLHVIDSDRVRTLEEIQDDLNNLFLNAQVVLWDEVGTIGANGCVFEKIRPDIMTGQVQLISTECPNSFAVRLTVPKTDSSQRDNVSRMLADALLNGSQSNIDYLFAESNSKFNPNGYQILLKRTQ